MGAVAGKRLTYKKLTGKSLTKKPAHVSRLLIAYSLYGLLGLFASRCGLYSALALTNSVNALKASYSGLGGAFCLLMALSVISSDDTCFNHLSHPIIKTYMALSATLAFVWRPMNLMRNVVVPLISIATAPNSKLSNKPTSIKYLCNILGAVFRNNVCIKLSGNSLCVILVEHLDVFQRIALALQDHGAALAQEYPYSRSTRQKCLSDNP